MKKIKTFTSGLIVGLLLTTSAFASSEQIQAMFTNFNLSINGQTQQLQSKPLVYNGTSYLPVREIAELLGHKVDFNSTTNTIALSKNDIKPSMVNDWISLRELATTYNDLEITLGDYITISKNEFVISIRMSQVKEGETTLIPDSNNPQLKLSVLQDEGTTFLSIPELKNLGIIE